jgi:putrescine transport system substrate-binding protein
MRPQVMASISNFIRYPNGYLGPHDPALYPTAAMRARLIVPKAMPLDYSRLVTREWTRFRTGN